MIALIVKWSCANIVIAMLCADVNGNEEDMEETKDIVIAAPTGVSLGQALHMNTRFATAAQYGAGGDAGDARWLTWATGNNEKFDKKGRTPLANARGWIIDRPDDDEVFPDDYALMDAMELLVEQGLAQECMVSHNDENGKPRKVASWHMPVASLFIVCQGIPSKSEMLADPSCRWGVAYTGWKQGSKSFIVFNCFVKELMDAGYNGIFRVKFSSFLTDKALACLKAQEYVLKFVDGLRAHAGNNEPVAWYAYAQPITCSTKTITAGKEVGKTKELYYPVPAIPRLSQRDPQAAIDYLARMAITENQAFIVEEDGRVERTVEWSIKASQPNAGEAALYSSDDDAGDVGNYEPVDIDGKPVKAPF
jgi:hypothetical protein